MDHIDLDVSQLDPMGDWTESFEYWSPTDGWVLAKMRVIQNGGCEMKFYPLPSQRLAELNAKLYATTL